jgi:hypothetical protein
VPNSLRGARHPVEQPAGEVDPDDRTVLAAGKEAALALEAAAGDDVLVFPGYSPGMIK